MRYMPAREPACIAFRTLDFTSRICAAHLAFRLRLRHLLRMSNAPLDPIALALDLCEIDSTSNREGEVVAFAEGLLHGRGWATTRIPVTPGRDALLATVGEAPWVTFSTHLDTVPPFIPPRREGGRLWGRG